MSFTFNNYNCETFGICVERYPERAIPAKKFSVYDVPGRSGRIYVPQGVNAFENVTQQYEVFVKDSTTLQSKMSEIAKWLLDPNEPKELRDSYDSSVYRLGMFIGGGDWANSLNKYGKATFSFDCGPQRYDYPITPSTQTLPSGSNGSNNIGTGAPKGNGYIDDPTPLITMGSSVGWTVGDEIVLDITNTVTSETTRIKFECTTAVSGKEIMIDTARGTIWIRNTITKIAEDIETYFDVTIVSGDPQMRFTYQVVIDFYNNTGQSLTYKVDPRWYRL